MNPSLRTLGELRRGAFVDQLDAEFSTLVTAVRDTGKKGSITIKIEVALASKGDEMTLKVDDAITVKLPQPERGQTIMFALADGRMSRKDPRQLEMEELKEVAASKQTMKEVV